jgi:Predicted solute binding protein
MSTASTTASSIASTKISTIAPSVASTTTSTIASTTTITPTTVSTIAPSVTATTTSTIVPTIGPSVTATTGPTIAATIAPTKTNSTVPPFDCKLHPNYSKFQEYFTNLNKNNQKSRGLEIPAIIYSGHSSNYLGYSIYLYKPNKPHDKILLVRTEGKIECYKPKYGIITLCIALAHKGHVINDEILSGMIKEIKKDSLQDLELKTALDYFNKKTNKSYNLIFMDKPRNHNKQLQVSELENNLKNSIIVARVDKKYHVGIFETKNNKLVKVKNFNKDFNKRKSQYKQKNVSTNEKVTGFETTEEAKKNCNNGKSVKFHQLNGNSWKTKDTKVSKVLETQVIQVTELKNNQVELKVSDAQVTEVKKNNKVTSIKGKILALTEKFQEFANKVNTQPNSQNEIDNKVFNPIKYQTRQVKTKQPVNFQGYNQQEVITKKENDNQLNTNKIIKIETKQSLDSQIPKQLVFTPKNDKQLNTDQVIYSQVPKQQVSQSETKKQEVIPKNDNQLNITVNSQIPRQEVTQKKENQLNTNNVSQIETKQSANSQVNKVCNKSSIREKISMFNNITTNITQNNSNPISNTRKNFINTRQTCTFDKSNLQVVEKQQKPVLTNSINNITPIKNDFKPAEKIEKGLEKEKKCEYYRNLTMKISEDEKSIGLAIILQQKIQEIIYLENKGKGYNDKKSQEEKDYEIAVKIAFEEYQTHKK